MKISELETETPSHSIPDDDWSPELAQQIAATCGVELGMEHWSIIAACREEALRCGCIPTLERLAILSGTTETRLRDIFLIDPARFICRIAGLESESESDRTSTVDSIALKGATP